MNSGSNPTNQEVEPTTGSARAPVWLFVLMALLAFWGMSFLDNHGGGFDARVYAPYRGIDELEIDQPPSAGNDIFVKGRKVFENYCMLCHQSTGNGLPGQFPPLAGSEWVLAPDPGRLIRLVLDGMQGPITVKGQQFPASSAMPPWKDLLKDEDIAAVLTYIRGNQEWVNNAPPVTADQVKAVREKVATRGTPWSPDELLKLPENE
jgi:mono/diheme cytochrome c family protein